MRESKKCPRCVVNYCCYLLHFSHISSHLIDGICEAEITENSVVYLACACEVSIGLLHPVFEKIDNMVLPTITYDALDAPLQLIRLWCLSNILSVPID